MLSTISKWRDTMINNNHNRKIVKAFRRWLCAIKINEHIKEGRGIAVPCRMQADILNG